MKVKICCGGKKKEATKLHGRNFTAICRFYLNAYYLLREIVFLRLHALFFFLLPNIQLHPNQKQQHDNIMGLGAYDIAAQTVEWFAQPIEWQKEQLSCVKNTAVSTT